MKVKVAARSYRSQTAKYSKSHEYSCLLFCVGTLRDQRHVTLLPPPATVFLLELSVCIVCEAKLVGLCARVCVWERCCFEGWWGQGNYKGSVCAVHGTVLAGTHAHANVHTCAHTLGTNRGWLWTPMPSRCSTASHCITLCSGPTRLLIFPSLYPSRITRVFFPSYFPHTTINFCSRFTAVPDIMSS